MKKNRAYLKPYIRRANLLGIATTILIEVLAVIVLIEYLYGRKDDEV